MRIIANFSPNKVPVPFNNLSQINGYIQKCLGSNNHWHDNISNYCVGLLENGRKVDDTSLTFEKGGRIVITSLDKVFIATIVEGIITNPQFNWGMEFLNIDIMSEESLVE